MVSASSMTSRERVLAVLNREQPDRVPVWCGAAPEFWRKAMTHLGLDDEGLRLRLGDDFRKLHAVVEPAAGEPERAPGHTPFGVPRQGLGYGQAIRHPLKHATLRQVHDYPWPGLSPTIRLVGPASVQSGRYAILGGTYSLFWHDLTDLLGMENACMKMYDAPLLVDTILQHVVDYHVAVNRAIFEVAAKHIDIFFIANDFGCQHGPFLSEPMFRRFLVPHLRRLVILGHDYGLKVMLHSCGSIAPLIPALIECGFDALHPVQPCRGMDLRQLKAQFGNRIVFNGAIDAQHTLIEGSPEIVRQKTREVLGIMKPGGGYVGGASHDNIVEETPVQNVLAMFDTLRAEGGY